MVYYLGCLLALLAIWGWLVVVAFRTAKRWGWLGLFVPPVLLVFVFAHWRQAARPFALLLIASGLSIAAYEHAATRGQGKSMTGVWREQQGDLVVRLEKGGGIGDEISGRTGRWKSQTRDAFLLEGFEPFVGGTYDPETDKLFLSKTGVGRRGPWTIKSSFVRADDSADGAR
jgi:hypothetical protein